MPLTKCPHCRKVQIIRREMLGQELGCLNAHCGEPNFVAQEYHRHRGLLSNIVFYLVIAFALYLVIHWCGGYYVTQFKHIMGVILR